MKSIYFLVDYKSDVLKVFKAYFENNGGFEHAILVAAVVALVVAAIFYLAIGFKSFKLSTIYTWVAMLVISMGITCATTSYVAMEGLKPTLNKIAQKEGIKDDPTKKLKVESMNRDFKRGAFYVKPVRALCVNNTIYNAFIYPLLSAVFCAALPKRNTCKNIPFKFKK